MEEMGAGEGERAPLQHNLEGGKVIMNLAHLALNKLFLPEVHVQGQTLTFAPAS